VGAPPSGKSRIPTKGGRAESEALRFAHSATRDPEQWGEMRVITPLLFANTVLGLCSTLMLSRPVQQILYEG